MSDLSRSQSATLMLTRRVKSVRPPRRLPHFGASLARQAGFQARGLTAEAAPTWKGIIHTAEEHHVSLIVVGAHRHTGLVGHLLGSVSAAVVSHATCSVLVVHQES
jgi:nucleotide-binding universal stress UspA family protein